MTKQLFLITILFFALLASGVSAQEDACKVVVDARETQEFIDMIDELNLILESCPLELPRGISWILGDGNILITVERNNSSETFAITQEYRRITSVVKDPVDESCTQRITLNEQALDNILAQDDRASSVKDAYGQGVIEVEGCTRTQQAMNTILHTIIGWFI